MLLWYANVSIALARSSRNSQIRSVNAIISYDEKEPKEKDVAQDRITLRPGFHFKVGSFMRQFAIDKGTPKYYALVKQDNMNGLQERLAGRDATIWVYEMLMEHLS